MNGDMAGGATREGLMQRWPLLTTSILRHARTVHAGRQVVSATVEGGLHRYRLRHAPARFHLGFVTAVSHHPISHVRPAARIVRDVRRTTAWISKPPTGRNGAAGSWAVTVSLPHQHHTERTVPPRRRRKYELPSVSVSWGGRCGPRGCCRSLSRTATQHPSVPIAFRGSERSEADRMQCGEHPRCAVHGSRGCYGICIHIPHGAHSRRLSLVL